MDLSRAGDLLRAFLADVEAAAYRGCHAALKEHAAPAVALPEELDSAAAAKLLGFPSPAALNRWADRHPGLKLPRHRVGQRWAFRRSELTEWVRLTEGTRWIHSRT